MFQGFTLYRVIVAALIIAATTLLSIAVAMQDHFLVFVALMICIGLVGTLFRSKSDDKPDEQARH